MRRASIDPVNALRAGAARVRVVVVGGGYAGVQLAKRLDPHLDVVLVEPRDAFVHNVAAIRAMARPDLLDRIVLPYDRLLRRGCVLRDRAARINDDGVTLSNGQRIAADIVVVATGSSYAAPFKPQHDDIATFVTQARDSAAQLRDAASVAIVGGGPVGAELAGEIAVAFPNKQVTLLTMASGLIEGSAARLSSPLSRCLANLGVTLRTQTPVTGLAQRHHPYRGTCTTPEGSIEADLIVPVLGASPMLPADPHGRLAVDPRSRRILVDRWLRPLGAQTIFAIGDAAATGEPMTVVDAIRQANWLARTICRSRGRRRIEQLPPYRQSRLPTLLVPLGPGDGASILPFGQRGWVVGAGFTSRVKGRDLFVSRYRKMFGLN